VRKGLGSSKQGTNLKGTRNQPGGCSSKETKSAGHVRAGGHEGTYSAIGKVESRGMGGPQSSDDNQSVISILRKVPFKGGALQQFL
jgi:hypothetical protein